MSNNCKVACSRCGGRGAVSGITVGSEMLCDVCSGTGMVDDLSPLSIITAAYDRAGIQYVVRSRTVNGTTWSYLFLVSDADRADVERVDLDWICRAQRFMEFQDGVMASY